MLTNLLTHWYPSIDVIVAAKDHVTSLYIWSNANINQLIMLYAYDINNINRHISLHISARLKKYLRPMGSNFFTEADTSTASYMPLISVNSVFCGNCTACYDVYCDWCGCM